MPASEILRFVVDCPRDHAYFLNQARSRWRTDRGEAAIMATNAQQAASYLLMLVTELRKVYE